MLVDLEFDPETFKHNEFVLDWDISSNGVKAKIKDKDNKVSWFVSCERIEKGIYAAPNSLAFDLNFHTNYNPVDREQEMRREYQISNSQESYNKLLEATQKETELGFYPNYGVADSIEQIKSKKSEFFTSQERSFIMTVQNHKTVLQNPNGFRWCKYGKYIGNKKPIFEYLVDEYDIDEVFTFQFIEVSKKEKNNEEKI